MALSRLIRIATGSSNTFAVDFALGYDSQADIAAQVEGEALGARTINFSVPGFMTLSGANVTTGLEVAFIRTVSRDTLSVDWQDGASLTDDNMDKAQLQALRLVHEALDRRFEPASGDMDMNGYKVANVGAPTEAADLVNKGYVDSTIPASIAAAAANAVQTAADRVQTGLDRVATAADRVQTGLDRAAVAADKIVVAADKVTTEGYRDAAAISAANAAAFTGATIGTATIGAPAQATPLDADIMGFVRTSDGLLRSFTFTNFKAFLKTYFDTIYSAVAHVHSAAVNAGASGFMTGADKTKLDLVGTNANRAITISASAPSGGADGDVWYVV